MGNIQPSLESRGEAEPPQVSDSSLDSNIRSRQDSFGIDAFDSRQFLAVRQESDVILGLPRLGMLIVRLAGTEKGGGHLAWRCWSWFVALFLFAYIVDLAVELFYLGVPKWYRNTELDSACGFLSYYVCTPMMFVCFWWYSGKLRYESPDLPCALDVTNRDVLRMLAGAFSLSLLGMGFATFRLSFISMELWWLSGVAQRWIWISQASALTLLLSRDCHELSYEVKVATKETVLRLESKVQATVKKWRVFIGFSTLLVIARLAMKFTHSLVSYKLTHTIRGLSFSFGAATFVDIYFILLNGYQLVKYNSSLYDVRKNVEDTDCWRLLWQRDLEFEICNIKPSKRIFVTVIFFACSCFVSLVRKWVSFLIDTT